jgi:hypothetical protein
MEMTYDNFDLFDIYEAEQARQERLRQREEAEDWHMDDDWEDETWELVKN